MLGLGDIGPHAAMPVMEGKAMLFKEFADVDAFPLCVNTQDVDEIVNFVKMVAPTFGGVNLEDIAAPRCFEIERRLRDELEIPVFHDDQHGTAIVVLAALLNALRVVGKRAEDVRVVIVGAGAAGIASAEIILAHGVGELLIADIDGVLYPGRPGMDPIREELAQRTNPTGKQGNANDVIPGADVVIGLSGPRSISAAAVRQMAPDAVVFAMANPVPEVQPEEVARDVAIMATGRSDYPNQINNVLAFPGVFRGALDVRASAINEEMKLAAAQRDRGRHRRRRAARRVHRPERLQPPGRRGHRRGGRRRGGRDRRRAPHARAVAEQETPAGIAPPSEHPLRQTFTWASDWRPIVIAMSLTVVWLLCMGVPLAHGPVGADAR